MRKLNLELNNICRRNPDGSFATQKNRRDMLNDFANTLHELAYHHMGAHSLREKHVLALLKYWQDKGLSPRTIANKMAALRWWTEKIGKQNLIAADNRSLGIPRASRIAKESKAKTVDPAQLARITDPYTAMSLALQEHFGLRREESIKIIPSYADGGDRLRLKASWTKGGRPREIPITTSEQRRILDRAKEFANGKSLIPADMRYVDQLQRFRYQCDRAGICAVHGIRHAYAQRRFRVLTGFECPLAGGPTRRALTLEQREADLRTRLIISAELGHKREEITAAYLGR